MKLYFRLNKELFHPIWQMVAYEGDVSNVGLWMQEYRIICGDICTDQETINEKLGKLRDEMAARGCEIILENAPEFP